MSALAVAVVCLLFAPLVRAMSVVPPTFAELVAEATAVVRGEVTGVRTEEFDSPQGRGIRTLVTFRVERTLKGASADTLTLTFLGGTVGKRSLRIAGMPSFTAGQREIVFVARNGEVLCPLIGAGHGRYHVVTEPATQREYVTRDNLVPLSSTDQISLPLESTAVAARVTSAADALTLSAFEAQIVDALGRGESVQQKP
ncbi:MAG: hypothetical protein NTV51_27295 [Verrucomicrobia bacterium]|nr:hypothetical protein [Verrucomicrobiota bacterium]